MDGAVRRHCPIDCKKEDGTYYPVNGEGLCTCPLCCYNCNLAYPYDLEGIIAPTEKARREGKLDLQSQVQKEKSLFKTMKNIMNKSSELATSHAEDVMHEMKNDNLKHQLNESSVIYLDDTYHLSKAQHAMSQLDRVDPHKLFGIGQIVGNKLCVKSFQVDTLTPEASILVNIVSATTGLIQL